ERSGGGRRVAQREGVRPLRTDRRQVVAQPGQLPDRLEKSGEALIDRRRVRGVELEGRRRWTQHRLAGAIDGTVEDGGKLMGHRRVCPTLEALFEDGGLSPQADLDGTRSPALDELADWLPLFVPV